MRLRYHVLLLGLLFLLVTLSAFARQALPTEVLQLLARVNTWTAVQTYAAGLVISALSPASTTRKLYTPDGTDLYWNGTQLPSQYTGTATYNPGTIADQTSVTTTLTVTGAAVGQVCAAALSTIDAENLLISAFPAAANSVRVVIGNLSGGGLTPGSGTLRAGCAAF